MPENSTRTYYDRFAAEYFQATCSVNLQGLWAEFRECLTPHDPLVLDIGCGSGRDVAGFASLGIRAMGVDCTLNLLQRARSLSRRPFLAADVFSLPFADSRFDGGWSMGVLLHFPRETVPAALREIHRVLKPGGVLFTSVKGGAGNEWDERGRFFEFYSMREWKNMVNGSGYRVQEIREKVEVRKTRTAGAREVVWIECFGVRL